MKRINPIIIMFACASMLTSCLWNGSNNEDGETDETDSLAVSDPSLKYSIVKDGSSFEIFCNSDTCLRMMVGLDLSTPDEVPCKQFIADWVCEKMNEYLYEFDDYLEMGLKGKVKKMNLNDETSAIEIQSHYGKAFLAMVRPFFENLECSEEYGYMPTYNFGLNAEIKYEDDDYCTFKLYEDWNFGGSNGCTFQYSYVTIFKESGEVLTLDNFVSSYEKDDIIAHAWEKLAEAKAEYGAELTDEEISNDINLTKQCALNGNSLIFYFYPYTVGCGAEGEYEVEVDL